MIDPLNIGRIPEKKQPEKDVKIPRILIVREDITKKALHLYMTIADAGDWVPRRELARITGFSLSTIDRQINALFDAHCIESGSINGLRCYRVRS